jgi:hypothetical protein
MRFHPLSVILMGSLAPPASAMNSVSVCLLARRACNNLLLHDLRSKYFGAYHREHAIIYYCTISVVTNILEFIPIVQ